MRACYQNQLLESLVSGVASRMPCFSHEAQASSTARKAADPIVFSWRPVGTLVFFLQFAAPGKQDRFEAYCGWSEDGKLPPRSRTGQGANWKHDGVFSPATIAAKRVMAYLQALSLERGELPRVMWWKVWEPDFPLADDLSNEAEWRAAMVEEELRIIPDELARKRVDAAVDRALADVSRLALPWFDTKLAHYRLSSH